MRLERKFVPADINGDDLELIQDYTSYCMDELGYIPDDDEVETVLGDEITDPDSWDYVDNIIWNWAAIHRIEEYEVKNVSIQIALMNISYKELKKA